MEKIPAPAEGQAIRVPKMLHPDLQPSLNLVEPKTKLEKDLYSADPAASSSVVVFVSKMFAVATADLPQNQRRQMTAAEMRQRGKELRDAAAAIGAKEVNADSIEALPDETAPTATQTPDLKPVRDPIGQQGESLIGFARLYSGLLKVGQSLFCILPKYDTSKPPSHPANTRHWSIVTISHLYMIMGRELVLVDEVPAGNVFGIGGLEGVVMRSATLCAVDSVTQASDEPRIAEEMSSSFANLARVALSVSQAIQQFLESMLNRLADSTDRSCRLRAGRSLSVQHLAAV